MNIFDRFNSKRKHSTYLQYQNGDILEVEEKTNNIDNAPKLDIQDSDNKPNNTKCDNQTNAETENSSEQISTKKKIFNIYNKIRVFALWYFLLALLVCAYDLSSVFIKESKEFINTKESVISEDKSLSTLTEQIQSSNNDDTQVNTTNNMTNVSDKYKSMLNVLTNTHNSIHNKLIEIKSNISSSSDVSLVQNKLIRTSFSLNTIKSELEENRELFIETSCYDLYTLLLNRIDNETTLINSLKKETSIENMITVLNNSIIMENNYVDKQTNLLQNIFDKNSIPYTIEDNTISWKISDN